MKISFGYPEALLAFAAVVSFINFNLCIAGLTLSVLSAIVRGSLEQNDKMRSHEDLATGARVLTDALSNVIKPKNDDRNLH
jgi:hypothetical protein